MNRMSYLGRALLYIALAVFPVLIAGYSNRTAYVLVALNCAYQSCLTIRAFIDNSRSEVKAADAKSTAAAIAAP